MATLVETIKEWPAKKKVSLLVGVMVVIASLILIMSWSQQTEYSILFTNLSDNDAGLIIQKLEDMKIPHKVDSRGVLVPEDRVHDLRLRFASEGLPEGGGVGFEIFDKKDFGATSFVQKLNYRRALQGELARTIVALTEVEKCRVHLSIPEKSLFDREKQHPSASVLLKLKPGRALGQNQVRGIVHLISSSIEGLTPENVTVVDSKGDMLTRPADDMIGLTSNQLEYQRKYERQLETRVLEILGPVVGDGKVRAKAMADLDFSRIERKEENFDPDGQVVRSQQTIKEKAIANAKAGVPGVVSNIPGKEETGIANPQSQSQKENDAINYEISKITKHIIGPYGNINRLSVAVLVDGTYELAKDSEEVQYAPRSEEELKKYEDLVKKSIGFNSERGDEVTVVNMAFKGLPEDMIPEKELDIIQETIRAVKYLAPLLAIALFFLLVLRPLLRTMFPPPPPEPPAPLPQTVAELERAMRPELPPKTKEEMVADWAKASPDEALALLKSWIGGE